jgi:hypothetical protein
MRAAADRASKKRSAVSCRGESYPHGPRTVRTGYPRDLAGHGEHPPHARWPGGARIAVQVVLNHEEGGENAVLHGDAASETFLSDIVGAQPFRARHMSMESLYEYGTRAGAWRLLRLFRERGIPLTIFGVGMALLRSPAIVDAYLRDGTRSRATAGAGSATRTCPRTSSASTLRAPSRRSRG